MTADLSHAAALLSSLGVASRLDLLATVLGVPVRIVSSAADEQVG